MFKCCQVEIQTTWRGKKMIMGVWTTALCWSLHGNVPNYRHNWELFANCRRQMYGNKVNLHLSTMWTPAQAKSIRHSSDFSKRQKQSVLYEKLFAFEHFAYTVWAVVPGVMLMDNGGSGTFILLMFSHTLSKSSMWVFYLRFNIQTRK